MCSERARISRHIDKKASFPIEIDTWVKTYHFKNQMPAIGYLDALSAIQDQHTDYFQNINVSLDIENANYALYRLNLVKATQLWQFMFPFENQHILHWILQTAGGAEKYIDVGAHIGSMSIPIAIRCPGIQVIAVEPLEENLESLRHNIELNSLQNIEVVDGVVSNRPGLCKFHINALQDGGGSLLDRDIHGTSGVFVSTKDLKKEFPSMPTEIEVEAVTLDQLIAGRKTVVKIDAEGFGYDVLLSGLESLKKGHLTSLVIEVDKEDYSRNYTLLKQYFKNIFFLNKKMQLIDRVSNQTIPESTDFLCGSPILSNS